MPAGGEGRGARARMLIRAVPSLDEKGSFLGPPWEELYRRG